MHVEIGGLSLMKPSEILDGVAAEAARFALANIRQLLKIAAILAAVELLLWLLLPANMLSEALKTLMNLALSAVFAITIHRLIILGEFRFPPAVDRRVLFFLGVMIAESSVIGVAFVATFAPVLAAGAMTGSSVLTLILVITLTLVLMGAALWIISRLLTVYPHIAVTPQINLQISSAWALSREPVWEIAKRILLYFVCATALYVPLIMLFPQTSDDAPTIGQKALQATFMFATLVASYIIISFFVSLASFVYRRLVDDLERQVATAAS